MSSMLDELETEMEKQLLRTKGMTKKKTKEWNEAAPLTGFPNKLMGPGPEHALNGWTPATMKINQAKQNETDIKRLVKMGMIKEDFEVAVNHFKDDVCTAWKSHMEQGKVFTVAISTFGVMLEGK